MTTRKKILIISIIVIIIVVGLTFILKNNKKNILFKSNEKNSNVNQIFIYDDLNVYDDYKSKKKIGSIESDSWFDIIDSKIYETDIWYKIKSNNKYGYIKGVDNYLKHVDEYITIVENEKVINIFFDMTDDISLFEENFQKLDYKIQKYNIYFKESYKLYYMLKKDRNLTSTPVVTANNMVYDNYVPMYDELIVTNLKDDSSNVLIDLSYEPDYKTCIKDKNTYLNVKDFDKTKKEYDDEIKEIKDGITKSEKLIEKTGGFLSEEMFKKIADMTTDSDSLETLKQRYVLIDTYKRYKELLKEKERALNNIINYQDGKEEVSLYVFKCN
jgi:hypothetical protein